MERGLLQDFKELILELNKIAPDIAVLDLKNNKEASGRVVRALAEFRIQKFGAFEEKIKKVRNEIVSKQK